MLMSGCPDQGLVCLHGLTRCGQTCADLANDRRNCGTCGVGCGSRQICMDGGCQCEPGATFCNGICTVTSSDTANCGRCGVSCQGQQICEDGGCKLTCTLENLATDPNNCGTCGNVCGPPRSCRGGACAYDIVVGCSTNGQAVGIVSSSDGGVNVGAPVSVSNLPQALGTLSGIRSKVLLVADGAAPQLLQVGLSNNAVLPPQTADAGPANQIWVEGSTIYLVSASSNLLQTLASDGGSGTTGFTLVPVGQFSFGADTSPQALVKVGTFLYVVLRGTDSNPDAGQKVIELDVTDPANPDAGRTFDLSGLDLRPFDGGTAVARPSGIAAVGDGGILYVALNNLRPPPTMDPAGPGVLAKIDLNAGTISRVDLPVDACLNAQWLVSTAEALFVSCGGATVLDGGFPISTDRTGIVALNAQDQRVATWSASCDGGCIPPSMRRFAAFGNRLYIGDQYGGRLFVMEKQLDAGTSLLVCPPDAGLSTVSDVISVP